MSLPRVSSCSLGAQKYTIPTLPFGGTAVVSNAGWMSRTDTVNSHVDVGCSGDVALVLVTVNVTDWSLPTSPFDGVPLSVPVAESSVNQSPGPCVKDQLLSEGPL